MRLEGFHVWHEEWVKPHFKFSLSRKEKEREWRVWKSSKANMGPTSCCFHLATTNQSTKNKICDNHSQR